MSREMDLWRAARKKLRREYYAFLRSACQRPSPLSPIEAKVEALLSKHDVAELAVQLAKVREHEAAAIGGAG